MIKLSKHKYIYIGWKIYEFKTNDEIIKYVSPIGNSDVPYPYTIGTKNTYLMIEDIYGNEDPSQVYYKENTMRVVEENKQYRLELYLPGVPKEKIELTKTGDELNIRIGNHRRNLVLPQALSVLQTAGAKMEDDYLKIRFSTPV